MTTPPKANGELGELAGRRQENENNWRTITVMNLTVKWVRELNHALDAIEESKSGDIGLVERNLVEGATQMLAVASEIRRTLRQ